MIPNLLNTILGVVFGIAGQCPIIGFEPKESSWNTVFLVYAEVVDVKPDEYEGTLLRLKPFATLSGKFDAALEGDIQVHAVINRGFGVVSMIDQVPQKNAKVLALILDATTANGAQLHEIPNGPVRFMSGHIGLVEVSGFDDPKVTETIENLRKLRGRQREEAEKAKADAEKARGEQKTAAGNSAGPKNISPEKPSRPQNQPAK